MTALWLSKSHIYYTIGRTQPVSRAKNSGGIWLDRTGLADMLIYDLRCTLGSWQASTGASLLIIGKALTIKVAFQLLFMQLELDPVRESVNRATAGMLM